MNLFGTLVGLIAVYCFIFPFQNNRNEDNTTQESSSHGSKRKKSLLSSTKTSCSGKQAIFYPGAQVIDAHRGLLNKRRESVFNENGLRGLEFSFTDVRSTVLSFRGSFGMLSESTLRLFSGDLLTSPHFRAEFTAFPLRNLSEQLLSFISPMGPQDVSKQH